MTATDIAADRLLWQETVPGGAHWSGVMRRGSTLRLTDMEGGANVALLMFNQDEKLERYNMADTLKAQHTARLTRGYVCYSDMGRVLCSITADTVGWHDPIGGVIDAQQVAAKYGVHRFQEYRNEMYRNARDGMLVELGKYGLGKRDFGANINLFSRVTVGADGAMVFQPGNSKAGDFVELRFEMNTLLVLSTCPHPLDPNPQYAPKQVQLSAWRSELPAADDYCRNFRPENTRGFYNTEILFRWEGP